MNTPTIITSLQELRDFYMRIAICKESTWRIVCHPNTVSTLLWYIPATRIISSCVEAKGTARVVTGCKKACEGCSEEVVDLSTLVNGLNFLPLEVECVKKYA